ncbi:MAG TPA: penicillin-binding protein 1A [Rhizomicrobium sp.]|jgi:penicillin-binding protein 1A|nr:penicillin-binding protein 1A [Rhizomicrobium sp.]
MNDMSPHPELHDAPGGGQRPPRKGWRRFLVWGGLGFGGFAAIVGLVVLGFLVYLMQGLPSVEALQNYTPPVTTRVYAGDGSLLGEYARERRIFVPIAFVPKRVIEAFTSAEDKNFYTHPGIDPSGIMRAAIKDVYNVFQGRRLEGASTITQQVAKNFLLTSDQNISRKIREAILAIRIDATYSKGKILELYLNEIFLGQNSYGVAAAALNYFDKSLDELDIAETAFLATLPKAPSNYDPERHHEAALDRRNWVIDQMRDNGYITEDEAKAAKAEPLVAKRRALGIQTQDAQYFVEEVRRQLYAKYGEKGLYDGGLQVRSTLDARLQNYAVNALRAGLVRYDRRHGWRGAVSNIPVTDDWKSTLGSVENQSGIDTWKIAVVLSYDGNDTTIGFADGTTGTIPYSEIAWARPTLKGQQVGGQPSSPRQVYKPGDIIYAEQLPDKAGIYGLRQVPNVNGAIVAMDPHTGRVLALSGGFSYASSQFDRAMQAMRQPGSTFKPFVYAAALDNGRTPISPEYDTPFEASMGAGQGVWRPRNFGHKFLGQITLRRAITLSLNNATAHLADSLGMKNVVPYPIRMGVYDHLDPYLANALGASETTLIRVVQGYAEFVNGGKKITGSLIDRVQDRNGDTIWRHDARKCEGCNTANWQPGQQEPLLADPREQVLDARTAYQIVSILQGVVQFGTGKVVSTVGKPLAGKTGTSNDAKDLWFVGFSPDLAAGVYVGFDNPRTMGPREQGALTAAPIFRDFMKDALADEPPTPFRVPPGISFVSVNRVTGKEESPSSPMSIMEAFKAGTEPGVYLPDGSMDPNGGTGRVSDENAATSAPSEVDTGGLY